MIYYFTKFSLLFLPFFLLEVVWLQCDWWHQFVLNSGSLSAFPSRRRMSATQCLAHTWLRRKPKPPPPVAEELDVAKDNLRFFVERWNEHPNSPYLFDKSCHTISPCLFMSPDIEAVPSQNSLGGLSPSPCSSLSVSISSSPDSIFEHDLMGKSPEETGSLLHYTFEHKQPPPPPPPKYHLERLQAFERRASDSSCVLRKSGDMAARVNLADEIRKLSDKLFQMASLHGPSSDLDNNNVDESQVPSPAPAVPSIHCDTMRPTSFTGTPRPMPPVPSRKESIQDEGLTGVKRPKFRFSNLNRDVPLGAPAPPTNFSSFMFANTTGISPCSSGNSSDTFPSTPYNSQSSPSSSHSVPLSPQHSPEADSFEPPGADVTKDLLLHLLHKWDDKQTVTCSPIETCRKAISMDWSEEESLGQRTMTSLATYFQSSRTIEKKHPVLPSQFGV